MADNQYEEHAKEVNRHVKKEIGHTLRRGGGRRWRGRGGCYTSNAAASQKSTGGLLASVLAHRFRLSCRSFLISTYFVLFKHLLPTMHRCALHHNSGPGSGLFTG